MEPRTAWRPPVRHQEPDGSYTLPLPPGTYLLFAEWFGNLHSQWQLINLEAGQQRSGVDLPLLQGQEVAGAVRDAGQPMRDALVQATPATGDPFTTRTFADGTHVLVLPPGPYRITAPGGTESVTVADLPIDGVDFPLAADASTPTLGTILTVAGNGIQGSGGDGRRATAARIQNPIGITVDAAGHLYIADNVGNRVRKVEAGAGVITTVAGRSPFDAIRGLAPFGTNGGFSGDGGAATAAEFNQPQSLAFDAVGNLYIGDTNNNRVRKVDVRGIITTAAGNGQLDPGGQAGDGGLATAARVRPVGVAVDAAGNLYLAEPRFGRVRKVDPSGIISTVAGGGTAAFTEGAAATSVALVAPRTLAVDGAGNLYISDDGLNRLLKLSPAGVLTTVAGTGKAGFSGDAGPAAQAELNFPVGVAVDRAGAIYFADRNNHRVRKVSADGVIATVVGSGPFGPGSVGSFAGDNGPAMEARLWGPLQVAIDGAGNLYVADNLNRRIRKVIGIAAPGLVGGQ